MRRAPATGWLSRAAQLGVTPPEVEEGIVLTTPVYAPKPGNNIRGRYLRDKIQKAQEGQAQR